ncbi:MAG: HAD-IA family hydrolase [Gaiellaceae bacterium]
MIFDLWNTIAEWPAAAWDETRPRIAERLGLTPERFDELWYGMNEVRETSPLSVVLERFEAPPETLADVVAMRRAVTQQGLVPRAGALETLVELRRRGFLLGLITVCSEDVPMLWPGTAFTGLFDSEIFSCSVGLRKPDPRIYLLACEQLGIRPDEAVFVGDGANDELAGAERVGMKAVLLEQPHEAQEWEGARIRELTELLSIV